MGAAAGREWVRWLPTMDTGLASKDKLMAETFGLASRPHRRQLADWLNIVGILDFVPAAERRWRRAKILKALASHVWNALQGHVRFVS